MPILYDWFEAEIESLKAECKKSGILGSSSDVGKLRELFVHRILRNALPSSVEICDGIIFDADDQRSFQQDVIIYRRDMPRLSAGDGPRLHFIEGVLATIQVKSFLDKAEFERSIDNLGSVKRLRITRGVSMAVGRPIPKSVQCYVFAYDSIRPDELRRLTHEAASTAGKDSLFDCLTVLGKHTMYRDDGSVVRKQYSGDFALDISPKLSLLLFFLHLLYTTSGFFVAPLDVAEYLKKGDEAGSVAENKRGDDMPTV